MNVLPFQRAWGKAKNCQSPWLSEKVWILVDVVTNVRIDSVSIAADPSPSLAPFLAKVLTLELTPTAKINGNGSFLVAKSDSFFFFSVRVVTACRSWQSDLACLSPVSRSTDHIADSCTHDLLAGFLRSHW